MDGLGNTYFLKGCVFHSCGFCAGPLAVMRPLTSVEVASAVATVRDLITANTKAPSKKQVEAVWHPSGKLCCYFS